MLAEDLMLLLLDETDGRVLAGSTEVENALAGAVLLDLVNGSHVGFGPDGKKLQRLSRSGDPFLDRALSRLDKPAKPQRAVERLRHNVRNDVMQRLADRGVLRLEKRKVLGVFPTTSWVIIDPGSGERVRNEVGAVLLGRREPDARTGALISLVYAVKAVHKVVEGDRRQLNARAKKISEGDWASAAVKDAVRAVQAAAVAAIMASVTASTAVTSSS
jgi:hypothetical protein